MDFSAEGSEATFLGTGTDLSLGGIYIETDHPLPFGTQLVVRISFPSQSDPLEVPATVRWTCTEGMGVQFGLLGARVTHAITEIARRE